MTPSALVMALAPSTTPRDWKPNTSLHAWMGHGSIALDGLNGVSDQLGKWTVHQGRVKSLASLASRITLAWRVARAPGPNQRKA